jgi:Fe-S cluster assembly ATP-binding protein
MEQKLVLNHLQVVLPDKQIISDLSLEIQAGEVHALMGPNGSGKSTLATALLGSPDYIYPNDQTQIILNGIDITGFSPEQRSRAGLYLAFQSPVAIPGVTVINLLRSAYRDRVTDKKEIKNEIQNPVLAKRMAAGGVGMLDFMREMEKLAKYLRLDTALLNRSIHDGFSGGEKKKIEILEALMLKPKYAIFDEIDTGLDVDALRIVAKAINKLHDQGTGIIIITHYQRILKYITPDKVHVLVKGNLVKSDGPQLVSEIEKNGYTGFIN